MRNIKLVDAVIQLHDIARLVEEEIGGGDLSAGIRQAADRLHIYSIDDDRAGRVAEEIIRQVKD
jgi:hypothetical protein